MQVSIRLSPLTVLFEKLGGIWKSLRHCGWAYLADDLDTRSSSLYDPIGLVYR